MCGKLCSTRQQPHCRNTMLRQEVHVRDRSIAVALSLMLLAASALTLIAQNAAPPRPARPAPRWPDGRVTLNSPPGEKGLWGGSGRLAINPRSYEPRTTLNAPIHIDNVPLQD